MTNGELKEMLARPGIYLVGHTQAAERTIVVSQDGKIYALQLDQELRPDGWSPCTYLTPERLVLGDNERIGTAEKGPKL